MTAGVLFAKLGVPPNPVVIVLVFFAYSFIGYLMECVVLTREKKQLVVNRGFVKHLPFCIIYGFGAMGGFLLLAPFAKYPALLFVVGAIVATGFEYATAMLQIRLFGDFWWDYTQKPFNYKGVLCLESTLGWGVVAIIVICFLHLRLVGLVQRIPEEIAAPMAVLLVAAYTADFVLSAKSARDNRAQEQNRVEFLTEDRREIFK